ncbi:MAG TPA: hypothetical protein VHD33_04745, partial [Legionellaceae bacterium]|nr:hypothetical protein [Legionellaceae bacterium]
MNILIVRIGRMGDMVMILPALREILKKYPNARLYAITSKEGLRLLPLVGIPKERIFVYRNGVFFRPLDNFRVKRWIKAVDFRHVFSFRKKKSNDKWLPKDAHILSPSTSLEHYSTRCLQLVSPQAPSQFFQREEPHYLPRDHHQQYIETLLKCYGIHERTLLVGLHPTYSGFKKWGNVYEKIHRLWPSTSFS